MSERKMKNHSIIQTMNDAWICSSGGRVLGRNTNDHLNSQTFAPDSFHFEHHAAGRKSNFYDANKNNPFIIYHCLSYTGQWGEGCWSLSIGERQGTTRTSSSQAWQRQATTDTHIHTYSHQLTSHACLWLWEESMQTPCKLPTERLLPLYNPRFRCNVKVCTRETPNKNPNTFLKMFELLQVHVLMGRRACKVNSEVVRNRPLTSCPDSGCKGVILWTWIRLWRTREQRLQASGPWRRGTAADWPGPAAADSLTETTPAASSADVQMDGWL